MKITIENESFELQESIAKAILTDSAFKLAMKIQKQGGSVNFTMNSIRKEALNESA